MMQRAVNAESKADLRSSTTVWDSDACCPKGHRPSYNTFSKVQTQGSKDLFRPKETKPKDPKSAPSRTMQRSHLKKTTERIRKRGSGVKDRNILESGKSRLWPPMSIQLMSRRKRRRSVTLVKSLVSTMIRKATLPMTAPRQKTSVGLSNLRASD